MGAGAASDGIGGTSVSAVGPAAKSGTAVTAGSAGGGSGGVTTTEVVVEDSDAGVAVADAAVAGR
jgi:hypothetical protein